MAMADNPGGAQIARLVVDHYSDVYRYAYRLSGSIADAEDLTQQSFLLAQRNLTQLRLPESARGWLYAILRNCYLKSRRRPTPTSAATLELDVNEIPAEAPPESPVDRDKLQHALDGLADEFKIVLMMFYFEDCSYKEIAQRLEIPLGTVMSRLSRGKAQLRGKLFEPELQGIGAQRIGARGPAGAQRAN